MLQVETEVGVANVEEIAAVPGVDSMCIGFLDLSSFLGVPGQLQNPKYLAAVDRIAAAAKKHGRVLGTAAPDEKFAQGVRREGLPVDLLRDRRRLAAVRAVGTDQGYVGPG